MSTQITMSESLPKLALFSRWNIGLLNLTRNLLLSSTDTLKILKNFNSRVSIQNEVFTFGSNLKYTAIVDSGTSLIIGPHNLINKIHDRLGGVTYDNQYKLYRFINQNIESFPRIFLIIHLGLFNCYIFVILCLKAINITFNSVSNQEENLTLLPLDFVIKITDSENNAIYYSGFDSSGR